MFCTMFCLIDCNNFFASCEQVFNPKLKGKPLVILSNNDGCIIARSQEAKALGIKMGEPAFKYRDFFKENNIHVLSSNFGLYGDLSERVMTTLELFDFPVEIYSIDEAFLHLPVLSESEMKKLGKSIKEKINQWLGLPIAIGFGLTKTLAKAANRIGKKGDGLCILIEEESINTVLSKLPVEDIWGIGRRSSIELNSYEIYSAKQLKECDDQWIKQTFSVSMLRIVWELRGTSCFSEEDDSLHSKSITSSRSFGKKVIDLSDLKEAVASYVAKAAEKLRLQKALAKGIHVYLATDHLLSSSASLPLPQATAYTPELIHYATLLTEKLFTKGKSYKKAGITLYEISSHEELQLDLLAPCHLEKRETVMQVIDQINETFGKKTLRFAAEGFDQSWRMRSAHRSPRFTTSWKELPIVH